MSKYDFKLNYIGYYAMDKDKNLHQYTWSEDDTFYIRKPNKEYVKADFKDYEILNIAYINML